MTHTYLSTACLHALEGEEPGHARCKLVCKYCETPCVCPCHDVEVP